MSAKKFDGAKPDLSLLPLPALEQMALAFMHGEKKYGRYNYAAGFDSHRLVAACLRHVAQWQDGEDLDPESGASHLGHALASLAMLLHTIQLGTNKDTRLGKQSLSGLDEAAVKRGKAFDGAHEVDRGAYEVDEKGGVYLTKNAVFKGSK